jgi:hypothetical protein
MIKIKYLNVREMIKINYFYHYGAPKYFIEGTAFGYWVVTNRHIETNYKSSVRILEKT